MWSGDVGLGGIGGGRVVFLEVSVLVLLVVVRLVKRRYSFIGNGSKFSASFGWGLDRDRAIGIGIGRGNCD